MTKFQPPPRLFESPETPSQLRRYLDCAYNDALSEAEAARLLSTFAARVTEHAPPSTADQGATRTARLRLIGKGALAVVAIGAGLLGATATLRDRATRQVSEAGLLHHVTVKLANSTLSRAFQATSSSSSAAAPGEEDLPADRDRLQSGKESPSLPHSAPTNGSVEAPPRGIGPVSRVRNSEVSTSSSNEADEYDLLRAARRALAKDPATALALADRHARLFPNGMLGQEREAIAVDALSRMGRAGQAKTRGKRILRSHPESPHAKRIEAAIGRTGNLSTNQ